jgi:hypothetical protein
MAVHDIPQSPRRAAPAQGRNTGCTRDTLPKWGRRTWRGDSGSGATLGDFKSESFAMGPGFVWIPKAGGGRLTVLGKWMHDFSAENRFESD